MSVTAAQCVKMVTASMLLSVFFLSGAFAACPDDAGLLITTPQRIEALSGSCLQIPCNFSANINVVGTFDGTRRTVGVWMKDGHSFATNPSVVIFNSSNRDNIHPLSITGNLSEKICTTLFSSINTTYAGTYYFRIENSPFKATAVCDPLKIKVKDSPQSPSIDIPGESDLREKQSVTITCSALTPCPLSPPKLTWNLQQDPHNITEQNTDRTFTTKIQMNITLSDTHDGFNISCSANYSVDGGEKTAEERKTLNVSYAPKDISVSISPSGLVSAGSWVNLTCSSRAKPPVSNFTWFKSSTDGPMGVFEGDFYSFIVTDGGVYFCVAANDLGNVISSEIHLTMKEANRSVQLGGILGGIIGIIALICLLVFVWRRKSTHSTAQKSPGQTGELPVEGAPKKEEEDIHYGEIDFSKRKSEVSSASERDSGQEPDTLYAQVKVTQVANKETADAPEPLYAQVKKR